MLHKNLLDKVLNVNSELFPTWPRLTVYRQIIGASNCLGVVVCLNMRHMCLGVCAANFLADSKVCLRL